MPAQPTLAAAQLRAFSTQPTVWLFSVAAGCVTGGVAALVLLGWWLDLDAPKAVLTGAAAMKPNVALCLLLLGIALVLSSNAYWTWQSRLTRTAIARSCTTASLIITGLTLAEHLGAGPFGIDTSLFRDRLLALATEHPGRMSPATALAIAMLSAAVILLDARSATGRRLSQWLTVTSMLVPFVAVLGYLYGAEDLHDFRPFSSMALHTALLITLVAAGVLFARPDRPVVHELLSRHHGGLMARRMLPFALLVPVVAGWLRLKGQREGLYGTEVGLALFAATNTLIFSFLIWKAARLLNREDADRRTADYHAVQALRAAESRWRALIEASTQIVWTTDANGVPAEDSPTWRAFTGQSVDQWRNGGRIEAIHPDDRERTRLSWRCAVATCTAIETEYRLRHVSGEWRWTAVRAVPLRASDGSVASWVGTNIDITDKKRSQSLAEGHKHVLEMIARDAPLGETLHTLVRLIESQSQDMLCSILVLDAEGKRLRYGAAPSLPSEYISATDGGEIGPAVGSCGAAASTRKPVFAEDIATDPLWKDYKHLALAHGLRACWSTPILDSAGRVLGTFAIYYDRPALPAGEHIRLIDLATHTAAICLTRHHAMQALRDSESRFRLLAESLPQLVWTCDAEGSCDYLSRQWVEFTGVPAAEQLGFGWLDHVHPEDRDPVREAWNAAVQHGTDFQTEMRIRRHDDVYRWFDTRAVRLLDDQGRVAKWCGSNNDVTDRKRSEESQLRSQKLEALGTLSGGIAHDFNNMLQVIAGNTQLTAEQLGKEHPAHPQLEAIAQASARATDLVRRILAFSRPQSARHKQIRLQPVIAEALKLVRATLPAMIEIRADLNAEMHDVAADATQIHQILVNLATNAAHAIGLRGGVIEVHLDSIDVLPETVGTGPDLRPGRYARLMVRDDGCGMSPDVIARIFDPFFTTKAVGQGTGLGLSIVHGIMQSCGGAVRVQSELGIGTSFHLYFPTVGKAAPAEPAGDNAVRPGGGLHILLIDDEESLVRLGTIMLTRQGYRVTGCTDPIAAVREFRREPHDFHAVVTDLSMPGMSGFDCARELLATRPDIPIVLTSGYLRPEDEAGAKQIGIRAVITKPAALDQLPEILSQVLVAAGA